MTDKIAVLITCFNRKEMTINCIKSLAETNKDIDFRFVVTDDNSSDGTKEALTKLPYKIKLIDGDGSLFWNGGMRKSIAYALSNVDKFDYALLVNDDVAFYPGTINQMVHRIKTSGADVVVGATCDEDGKMTYGGVLKTSKHLAKFKPMEPGNDDKQCDTFNCNAVLLKSEVFKEAGNFDSKYTHAMGDYDYGFRLRKLGYTVVSSTNFVGHCEANAIEGTWLDPKLPRKERLKLKEGPKGLPKKDYYHFVRKNYGLLPAIYHSLTPYIRILIKK